METVTASTVYDLLLLAGHMDVVHHIPGRIRLRAQSSLLQAVRGKDIRNMVDGVPGLLNVRVSPVVGSVVIEYDKAKLPYELWERLTLLKELSPSVIKEILRYFGLTG